MATKVKYYTNTENEQETRNRYFIQNEIFMVLYNHF